MNLIEPTMQVIFAILCIPIIFFFGCYYIAHTIKREIMKEEQT